MATGWTAPLLAVAMLSGIAVMRASWQRVLGNPAEYHRAVRAAAMGMPLSFGSWTGSDQIVPQPAVDLLKANLIVSRRFKSSTGTSAEMLLVQCQDPRDLVGHYPPICYPAQGWALQQQSTLAWNVDGSRTRAVEYTFARSSRDGRINRICVANLMLLPNATTTPDMAGVTEFCRNHRLRPYGAAELQILLDAGTSKVEREATYRELLDGTRDLVHEILRGGQL